MLDFGFYNMDCMQGMKEFPDKYFDLPKDALTQRKKQRQVLAINGNQESGAILMSDYILRYNAIAFIESVKEANKNEPCSEYHVGYTDALKYVVDALYANEDNTIPAADVEPVVHCKDCMHNGTYDTDCPMRGWFINDDDYCSRAEKMDGDKE